MTRRSALNEDASSSLATTQDQGPHYNRRFRYPGQRRRFADVLSDLRIRHWWQQPEITDAEAQQVWDAFIGDGPTSVAMGRLVYELHEYGRLTRRRDDR